MDKILAFADAHWVSILFAAYWVFSAAVSTMPPPTSSSAAGYVWFYRFGHSIAGSVGMLMKSRFPQMPDVSVQTVNPTPEGGIEVTSVQVPGGGK